MSAWAPDDVRPGTGRCFMSRNAIGEKGRVFAEVHCIYIYISLLKTKHINTNIYIMLELLKMNNMQQTSAFELFAVFSKCNCGFHLHYCQSHPQLYLYQQPVFMEK